MITKNSFALRALATMIVVSIMSSVAGMKPVSAEISKPNPQLQAEKLEATLDGSVRPGAFRASDVFIVHFNAAMNPQSSTNPLLTFPYVDGTSTWDAEKDTLRFTPTTAFHPGETYLFFIDPALTSLQGSTFDSSPQWTLEVRGGTQVVSVSPTPGLLSMRKPMIEVEFDRLMDRASAEKSFSIKPETPFKLSWKNDRVMQVQLNQVLQYGQQYTFLLGGGLAENSAMGRDGTPLDEDYGWSYGLEPFSTHLPPTTGKSAWVKFSHDLDISRTGFPFTISPHLEGRWRWQGSKTAMFIADKEIPFGQVYSLEITGPLYDADGVVTLDDQTLRFVAPPPFSSFEPSENGNAVPAGFSPIIIEFKTDVDHPSAEQSFGISPEVPGRFEWSAGKDSTFENILSFYPSRLLQYNTRYTVTMNSGLVDPRGNPLLIEPFSWTFQTTYGYYGFINEANFGYGTKVQIVDVNGSRRIQFGSEEKEAITFEAYAYDLIDFASLYAEYAQGKGILVPNTAEKEPTAIWSYREVNPDYQETIIPPEVPPGLYVLNMRYGGRSYDQLLVALTRNTIVVKRSGDELFVWLSNINGENVPGAEIRLYSDRGEKIREGKTDENGLYRVTIPDGYNPMLISARTGDNNKDVSITGVSDGWREYASGFWSRSSPSYKYHTYIYTDRPIFRPGQTVNFKAIVSRDRDLKYSVPEVGTPVTVYVRDAKNNLLQTSTLETNEFGSVNGLFTIAEEAGLGNYKIETVVNGESSTQTFKVQDYRKPDFKVTVSPTQADQSNKYINKDKIVLNVDTDYFFGEPVANAKLTFKIYSLVPKYYWWGDSSPNDVAYNWYANAYSPGISHTVTDSNGQAQVSFNARFIEDYYTNNYDSRLSSLKYRTYAFEVTAEDGSNQPVSSSYIFNVYNSAQKITLDTQGYFKQANQPFTVTIQTSTLDDQPLGEKELTLQVHAWSSENFNFDNVVETFDIKTNKDGLATRELKLSPGFYKLILSGRDDRDTPIKYERWLRILSSGRQWNVRNWDPITISAEQDEYKPYETARFAIESTVSGPALLTFERGSVIHSKFITLTAPLTVVEAEIIPEDAPNVFVTVNAWAPVTPPSSNDNQYYRGNVPDSRMLMAATELQVTTEAKKLQVDISTDKLTYSPGEKVTVNIDVRDFNGNSELAEVSLAVVDESIFSLSNELAPNIFTSYYGPRNWTVSTFTSMSPFRIIFDGGGRGGGGGDGPAANPRADFQDTAAWFPALQTDSSGRATITFTLPDNLTSWRLSAKAITQDHLVGQSHTNIETKKDLLLRPLLPRILTTGDQTQITTMVHNYSETDQRVRVTLNAPGFKVNSPASQTVTIAANGVSAVGWSATPEGTKETNITFTAAAEGNLNDSIRLPLIIQPLAIKDVQSISGKFNGSITLPLPLPPDILTESSSVTLKVSRTPASTILDGLDYLTGYPYGCVEQTMSRAMPNAVLGRASSQLGIGSEEFNARTKPLIEASIQKLYGLQHSDGGWGWWYDDYSDPYQTAWVLHGLSNIREAGYFIDPQVLENGSTYLGASLDEMDIRTRAYALYSMSLAGHGNLNQSTALMDASLTQLDPFSQAALALTLHQLGEESRAGSILSQLEKSVIQKGDIAYWAQSTGDGEYRRKTMSSTIRTTAMSLSAFVKIRGSSALADAAANYLVQERTGYGWGTTNETSFTILGLTDYLAGRQEFSGASEFMVEVNGDALATGTLQAGNLFTSIEVPVEQLESGLNNIKLTASGTEPLYYDIVTRYTAQKVDMEAAGNIIVTRQYLDPETNKPLERFTAGQLVKVQLTITMPEDVSFVIVEDRLPGGLEALNEGLNSTTQDILQYESNYFQETFFWQDYGYNYKEIRGDRVSFFITEIREGSRVLKYFARATTIGTFTALPAESFAMYDEQMWGRSSSAIIKVTAR